MKKLKIIFTALIYSLLIIHNSYSLENKILIKINNEIITTFDIFTEIKYLETINDEFRKLKETQAFEVAKKSLIREKIKEIELKKNIEEIKIDNDLLNKLILNYFEKNGIKSISEFESYFLLNDIDPNFIKKKISIEVSWNQMIYSKFSKNIKIDKKLILSDLQNKSIQKEYLLSEILFNLNENEKLVQKFNFLKEEINKKNFSQTALEHSISESANKGGKLGWIKEASINVKIKKALNQTEIDNYTSPIVIPGGFLILKLEDIRETNIDYDINDELQKIVKKQTNEQLNQFSNIYFSKVKKDVSINEL
jgi:peptidyl-prolyl cis-trans isomerase SurA|tara:strand:+ start:178 stop:1104 length:927 start_codon:yes stop_codon:yes gene_type:complete